MTSPLDDEAEVTRLRRTFRVAVIAAAVGATIGAGVVFTVVGAVFSVIERPAAQAGKTEKPKAAVQAQKSTPQETPKTPPVQASPQPQPSTEAAAAPPTPRRIEEPPAPKEANCQDQTWPYLDGKCLTPADDRATRSADTAVNGPAASPAPEPAPVAATATPAPAQVAAPAASAATPETTGSAAQPQQQPAVQPAAAVATTGAAPPDTPADLEKKPRKKTESARREQQKRARPDDKNADRRLATRGERDSVAARGDRESPERNSTRDSATQSSRFWGTRAVEPDDEAVPRTRTLVVVPARSQTDVSSEDVTTRKQRRSARSRPDLEPRVEEREIPRRDTSGEGGRDFFGGLFGGERD
ncbi:MAG TPA: hypothetical protein VH249_16560 [Xanthobacteraceae bacterium]|jgi:hypothetical protein|nr:hypothetical protein [Xanthobacteraceae bacterium]